MSSIADQWRQVFACAAVRPASWCVGCGFYRVAHGAHRLDCTATGSTTEPNTEASQADIVVDGKVVASVVYRPDHPLSCGARVWIETEEEVQVL